MSKSRDQVIAWLSKIDITDKVVLDVGAGPKERWVNKFTKGKPRKYITCDIEKFDGIDFVFDLEKDDVWLSHKESPAAMNYYDYVFCLETMEHISDPVKAVESLSLLTKERLFISSPFINPHHDKWDYIRLTGEWYERRLAAVGFKDIKIIERVATVGKEDLINFYKKEAMRISKIRPEYGSYTYPIGYCIEATK